MSVNGFQWLGVFLGLLVMPSAVVSPKIFQRIGLASGCVVGNIVTGMLTMALLLIANIEPVSHLTFSFFICALYVGFPFTVLSQLSTSPMLDRISPTDQRGLIQGVYSSFFNLASALSPWLLGLLADATSTNTMIWVGVAISFGAALVNLPLILQKEIFGPDQKEEVSILTILDESLTDDDEQAWEEKVYNDEYIPARILNAINLKRILEEKPMLTPKTGTYAEDKVRLEEIRKQAKEDFTFYKQRSRIFFSKKNDPDMKKLVENTTKSYSIMDSNHEELGKWFADYLKDNGYIGPASTQTVKLMITKAFPTLVPGGVLKMDNFEHAAVVNTERVFDHYIGGEIKSKKYGLTSIFKSNARRL